MAEPRKVPFVTISSFGSSPQTPEPGKKRRREDEAVDITFGKDGGGAAAVGGLGGGGGMFGKEGDANKTGEEKPTVRLSLTLTEPNDRGSSEFNYGELLHTKTSPSSQVKLAGATVPKGLAPPLDPSDPFADDEKERREVEELARKFENKYGGCPKKKKKDRMQDLIDIGYGYDETDPFIDNSEAYDELVPASLTTKHGGFYINTGTLQFRPASDSEGDNTNTEDHHFKKMKDGEDRVMKKRRKKQDGGFLEDKKPRKNKLPKPGVSALNVHRPEKKKRKKLMKDSLHLANMLRRFTREKEEMRKKNMAAAGGLPRPNAKVPSAISAPVSAQVKVVVSDNNVSDLTDDQAVMSLLGSANNDMLQDMMGDLDFGMLDSPQPGSPTQGENGSFGHKSGGGRAAQANMMPPPPLPGGLPGPLAKRIEDLRAASRLFDEEGRKKFFTLDMNNILLDIELQVQEQPAEVRSAVYSHLEAFVPCNKEALLKRLKKLSLNVQDDRLRTPLLKLKLAVCSVMPEQVARYNMDCIAKVAKQQSEEGDKNGSEDDDEEKPGKRVMGPRKKFVWDDKLRLLLCNLVQVKLGCYELEGKNTLSLEEYLKAFMETEVKPLWPKGWMQARMLFKESIMVHGHLTGYTVKKKMFPTKPKPKEVAWVQRPAPSVGATPSPAAPVAKRPPLSPPEPICLSSLDDSPSFDSISQALAILGNAAKGLAQGDSPPSPDRTKTATNSPSLHTSALLQQQKKNPVGAPVSNTPHYISTSSSSSPSLARPVPNVSSPSLSRPAPMSSSPLSRPAPVSSSPSLSRPAPVSSSLSRATPVSSSPTLSRPVVSSSPSLSRTVPVSSSPSMSRTVPVSSPSLPRTVPVSSSPSMSRTVPVSSSLSRTVPVSSSPSLSRATTVSSPSLSRATTVSSSPSLSRATTVSSSPSLSRATTVSSSPSLSRPAPASSSPSLSRAGPVSSPSLSRAGPVSSPSLSRAAPVSSSPSLSRAAPNTSSSLTSVRPDGMGTVKVTVQTQRHSVLGTQRPLGVGVTKTSTPVSVSPPKPRPPPTASPLVPPGSKTGASTPFSVLKGSNTKANDDDALIVTSSQTRPHSLASIPLIVHKTFQASRLAQTSQSKPTPSTQTLTGGQTQPQSNFITPMHATLTKSTHSSIPPIIKLTPRTPNPTVTTTSSSPSPSVSQSPRSQAAPSTHQYTPKTPIGFRPPFSGVSGGATVAKTGQGSYTPPSSQKTPTINSTTNTSLINTSSVSKHSGTSSSPAAASATSGQRQRTGGGTPQGAKTVVSVPQVSTAGSGSLLSSASSLPLGFGMLGGLVPVSMPFQFPSMLNLPQLGTGGSSPATSSSAASSNAAFSTLTQNLYKSLQSGSQVALPPHLQLAFSDVSQSQGGDNKRKTL